MLQRFLNPTLIFGTLVVFIAGFATYVIMSPSRFATGPTADDLWPGTSSWADERLASMTLEEKVSQLFSVRAYGRLTGPEDPEYRKLVDLVENFGIGGITFFQGEPLEQAALTNDFQQRAGVPLLISQDMEWGSGMRLEHATTFPRAMALGAARDPEIAYLAGFVTGREARALGTHHVFAPVADINNNPNNPIINVRSFGESAELVAEMATSFALGVQEAGAIATAKHFPGHGDTATDSHIGLPVLSMGLGRLESVELVPFRRLIHYGIMSVMTGHLAVPRLESEENLPATLSHRITTDLLRDRLGFNGIIVTDGLDMGGVTAQYSTGEIAVRALQAGADVLLLSEDPYVARDAILKAVEEGRLSEGRIDVSAGRLLRAKAWLGLDISRTVDLETVRHTVGSESHVALSHTIGRRSLTLLRNEDDVVPLRGAPRLLSVTLSDAPDSTAGAAFVSHLAGRLPDAEVVTHHLDGQSPADAYSAVLEKSGEYDVVIVPAIVNVRSWSGRINLPAEHAAFLERLVSAGPPVVLISFGNPYIVTGLTEPAVYLAAYSSSEASQLAAAEALVGETAVGGRLPIRIPGQYAVGDGLDLPQRFLRSGFSAEVGLREGWNTDADSVIYSAIADRAFPGAALAVGRAGVLTKLEGYGYHTYDAETRVTAHSVFDIASLTKVIATTAGAMKLFDEGRFELDDRVVDYLPAFGRAGKEKVTLRHLLTHSAGLIPFRSFYQMGVTKRQGVIDALMEEELIYEPGSESRYSDFSMIAMMLVIEQITGKPFGEYVTEHIFAPLDMRDTGFRKTGVTDSTVVPTERDAGFRDRLLQGEVHDETAWILGGVAGNAGVFSTAGDLARFAYMLVNDGRVDGKQFLDPETIRLFTRVQDPDLSTRALGWDTRAPEGYSSAGERFGSNSFGHTGFTGTSLWIDPDEQLFVILLTNRVFPTRDNSKIVHVRPRLADLAHGAIIGPPTFILAVEEPVASLGEPARQ